MSGLASLATQGRLTGAVPLGPLTTYKVGGPARWFMDAGSEQDLVDLAEALQDEELEVLVLGRGSNVLVADAGFDGVVVHLGAGLGGLEVDDDGLALAGAALSQPALARGTAGLGRGGLEFMVGIPGSVGGAVRMNAGCRGSDTAGWLMTARIISLDTGRADSRTPAKLGLRYRHSDLTPGEVVVSATFCTIERSREECDALLREVTRWRKDHQPGGTFNAGSVFKNPEGGFAGKLIDDLGLKGHRVGGASVSERHANFVVADPGTTAADVHSLILEVQARVQEGAGVRLEPEMRFVGDFGARP